MLFLESYEILLSGKYTVPSKSSHPRPVVGRLPLPLPPELARGHGDSWFPLPSSPLSARGEVRLTGGGGALQGLLSEPEHQVPCGFIFIVIQCCLFDENIGTVTAGHSIGFLSFFMSLTLSWGNVHQRPASPAPHAPGNIFCCHLDWEVRAIKGNLCLGHTTQLLSIIRHIESLIV